MADLRPYPGTPRWVTILAIVALALILLAGIVLFSGAGGPHGPRRHGATDDYTRRAVVLPARRS